MYFEDNLVLKGLQVKVKTKHVAGVFLIFMFLFGIAQIFLPVTEGQQGSLLVDRSYWLRLANNAWNYYQQGVSVDSTTGLHSAVLGYPYFRLFLAEVVGDWLNG
jgi:hypothetical protein